MERSFIPPPQTGRRAKPQTPNEQLRAYCTAICATFEDSASQCLRTVDRIIQLSYLCRRPQTIPGQRLVMIEISMSGRKVSRVGQPTCCQPPAYKKSPLCSWGYRHLLQIAPPLELGSLEEIEAQKCSQIRTCAFN